MNPLSYEGAPTPDVSLYHDYSFEAVLFNLITEILLRVIIYRLTHATTSILLQLSSRALVTP